MRRAALGPGVHVHHRFGRFLPSGRNGQITCISKAKTIRTQQKQRIVYLLGFREFWRSFLGRSLRAFLRHRAVAPRGRLAALEGGRLAVGLIGRLRAWRAILRTTLRAALRPGSAPGFLHGTRVRLAVGQASGLPQLSRRHRRWHRRQFRRHFAPLRGTLFLGAHHFRPQRSSAPNHQLDDQLRLLQPSHAIQPSHVCHWYTVYREYLEKRHDVCAMRQARFLPLPLTASPENRYATTGSRDDPSSSRCVHRNDRNSESKLSLQASKGSALITYNTISHDVRNPSTIPVRIYIFFDQIASGMQL